MHFLLINPILAVIRFAGVFFQIKYDFMVVCMGMQLNFNQVSCLLSTVGTNTYRPQVSLVSKEKNDPPLKIYNVIIPLF